MIGNTKVKPSSFSVQYEPRGKQIFRERPLTLPIQLELVRTPHRIAQPPRRAGIYRVRPEHQRRDGLNELERADAVLDALAEEGFDKFEGGRVEGWPGDANGHGEDGGEEEGGGRADEEGGVEGGVEEGGHLVEVGEVEVEEERDVFLGHDAARYDIFEETVVRIRDRRLPTWFGKEIGESLGRRLLVAVLEDPLEREAAGGDGCHRFSYRTSTGGTGRER